MKQIIIVRNNVWYHITKSFVNDAYSGDANPKKLSFNAMTSLNYAMASNFAGFSKEEVYEFKTDTEAHEFGMTYLDPITLAWTVMAK